MVFKKSSNLSIFDVPDATVNAHDADLKVTVAEVGKVEVDGDGFRILTFRSFVGRHVWDGRRNAAEIRLLKPDRN